jgi:TRAP-type mannitol/chloroaromatic compound transport system permease small subunit
MLIQRLRAVEQMIQRLGGVVAWATLMPLIAVSFSAIIVRRLFNIGSTRLQELQWYLFLALVMLSLGSVYLRDAHIRLDVLSERLTPRTRAWIELVGVIGVLTPFCLILIVNGGDFAHTAFMVGERSRADLGLPMRWIPKSMLPVGGLLLLLAGLITAVRQAMFLLAHPREPSRNAAARAS